MSSLLQQKSIIYEFLEQNPTRFGAFPSTNFFNNQLRDIVKIYFIIKLTCDFQLKNYILSFQQTTHNDHSYFINRENVRLCNIMKDIICIF